MPNSKAVDSHNEICFIPTVALQSDLFDFQQNCAAPPANGTYEFSAGLSANVDNLDSSGLGVISTASRLAELTA